MIKKIKEYFEYRKNKKIAKRAIVNVAASVLPAIDTITAKGADIVRVLARIAEEAKNTNDGDLVEMVLDKVAEVLKTDNSRLVDILTYMVNLQPNEIQKILVHSMVKSNPEIK